VYPYGFTLPVALTQDWGVAQDVAAAAAVVVAGIRRSAPRIPAPGAISMSFLAFVVYALLTPPWAYRWESHPGNEPKTLRMAVAAGHWLSLDVEPVSGPMEALDTAPFPSAIARVFGTAARETGRMAAAIARGEAGREAIRATRVTRQTIRGKEGGVFHVLAPGPSILLAPALRADRWLNLRDGRTGRVAVAVLLFNALAALLVGALFALLRDATGRPGLSALVAGAAALTPPFLFYFFQFYPEMVGALVFAVALRWLLYRRHWPARDAWAMGLLLATLPWLHQKFLPAWGVLAAWALLKLVGEMGTLRAALGLVVPQAATSFLFALYSFTITGSVRPDALFLAWGPGGVSGARVGQGLLGLLLDARYGIVPYVPALLFAGAGLLGRDARTLRRALPAMAAYYLTVAAADNWSGAVCNLGRYFMPVAPFALALVAMALARAGGRPGVRAVALTLAGWTAVVAVLLWRDPHAANDCAQLLARSAVADGNVYVPNLFLRTWADAAPGLWARVLAWAALAAALAWWTARGAGTTPGRALAGGAALVLLLAFGLERWPSGRRGPAFAGAADLGPGVTAFVRGTDIIVRARAPIATVRIRATGHGAVRAPGVAPFVVAPGGTEADVPAGDAIHLTGRRGVEEWLYRPRIGADGRVAIAIVR
jgi:hypothetical protein